MLLAAISAAEAAVYLAAEVAGLVLNGGIVWYLREAVPENKRTIINRLIAYQCLLATLFVVLFSNTAILSKILGGLNVLYCEGFVFAGRGLIWSYFLAADAIVVLRYIFTCRFKNVLACNDDLVYKAITLVIGTLPVYFASLLWFSGVKFTPSFYVCLGQDPADDSRTGNYIALSLTAFTLALHVVLAFAIFRSQSKVDSDASTTLSSTNITKASITTLRGTIGASCFIIAVYALIGAAGKAANRATGERVGDAWPSGWSLLVLAAVIPATYYFKNGDMAEKVWREISKAW